MSLVVVVAEANLPAELVAQLKGQLSLLGYETVSAASPQLAQELCRRQQATMAIVMNQADAEFMLSSHSRVPVTFISPQSLAKEDVINLMRTGVSDLWEWPMPAGAIAERIMLLRHRFEAQEMQAERELAQLQTDIERDQRAGRYIQLGMLPPNPKRINQFEFAHRIQPSLILSGDFVDYFRMSERYFALYVADVAGHGASSAFVTVLLKNFSRRLRREYEPSMLEAPGEILQWLNRELLEQQIGKHVTLFLAIGDTANNTLRYVNAGHYPPAIIVSASGAKLLEQSGKPVGLFEEVSYTSEDVELQLEDRLVVFSDGVLEILPNNDVDANESLLMSIATAKPTIEELWRELVPPGMAAAPDDMTALVVTRVQ